MSSRERCSKILKTKDRYGRNNRCLRHAVCLVDVVYRQDSHEYNYSTADYFEFPMCKQHSQMTLKLYEKSTTWEAVTRDLVLPEQQGMF